MKYKSSHQRKQEQGDAMMRKQRHCLIKFKFKIDYNPKYLIKKMI